MKKITFLLIILPLCTQAQIGFKAVIAGLINLVSKTPGDKRELSFVANATSAKGTDLSGFYSERYGKAGIAVFASHNTGSPYDPAGNGFTAIPGFTRYTLRPGLYLYGKNTKANLTLGYIAENRLGGSVNYIKHGTPGYFEQNGSSRFTSQFSISHQWGAHASLNIKNSYNHFNRNITVPLYRFKGVQQASFSELSWHTANEKTEWVAGGNVYTDNFREAPNATGLLRNYDNNTVGVFVQNTWSPLDGISLESGLRADYTRPFGMALLPRLSVLVHTSGHLTLRAGGGLGYKTPSIFTEETEERQFKGILPLNERWTQNERSAGGNFDLSYHTSLNGIKISVNPLIFYTRILHPLVLTSAANGQFQCINATGYTDSKGVDISARIAINAFKIFTGYAYTQAQNHFGGITSTYPLAPHHRLHVDLVYELEAKLRVALESYYTSKQQLSDGSAGRGYWLLGALVEKTWKNFSLFIKGGRPQ